MTSLSAIAAVRRACLVQAGLVAAKNTATARQELPRGGKSNPVVVALKSKFPNIFKPVKTGTGFAKKPAVENT